MKKIFFVLGLILSLNNANAQWSRVGGINPTLLQNPIYSIASTNIGYLYVGNRGDHYILSKWDGSNWQNVTLPSSLPVPVNSVHYFNTYSTALDDCLVLK